MLCTIRSPKWNATRCSFISYRYFVHMFECHSSFLNIPNMINVVQTSIKYLMYTAEGESSIFINYKS